VSIGVANGDGSRDFEQVLKQADRALYRAKAKGRNQVQAA
jgi:diguanylate cyclase (GGDEF)-like protein